MKLPGQPPRNDGGPGGRRAALAAGLLAAGLLAACGGHRAAPPSTEIEEADFRNRIRLLASEEFEGRRPATSGEERSVEYLVTQFRKLGLKPGNGSSYLQSVPLPEVTAARDASLRITGHGGGRSLLYDQDAVLWTPGAVSEAAIEHSALVFAGYGIVAPEYGWNDYEGTDVRGKTVVVLLGDPGRAAHDPRVFRGNAMTPYGLWRYKVAEAARQGAAGVLLVHDATVNGYGWGAVQNAGERPRRRTRPAAGAAPSALRGAWVSMAAARALFAQAGADLARDSAAAGQPGFKAMPLGLIVDARVHNALREVSSANVVAVLPGAHRPGEYVLYTAHWDHLGRRDPAAGGELRPGAIDDAAGVAGLLVLAQSISRTQPPADRSIVFIAFTGTESGLLGSGYYVSHPLYPLRDTVAALNLDALRIGGPTRDVAIYGFGNSELDDYVRSAALLQGREVRPEPYPQFGQFFRSDQFSFARRGVPVVFVKGGIDDAARGPAWGRAQIEDYLLHRYRQAEDRYSEDWDLRGTLDDLRLYLQVGNRLARSRRFPRWYPQSEYRTGHVGGAQADDQAGELSR